MVIDKFPEEEEEDEDLWADEEEEEEGYDNYEENY